MVAACNDSGLPYERVSETVAVVERPSYHQTSVYSELVYTDNRRHKEQVDLRPVLHPVKYSDTAYLWLNNTRRRFVSRTFYEPRVRPRSYSETTFARAKTAEQRFVSFLDVRDDEKRKWYKTALEIQPRKFTSSKMIRSANNNYIGTDETPSPYGNNIINNKSNNNDEQLTGTDSLPNGGSFPPCLDAEGFAERVDPGASQVYIPVRLERRMDQDSHSRGDLLLDFVNGHILDGQPLTNGL